MSGEAETKTETNGFVELYRKYRPTKFSDVIGQKEAVQQINVMGKSKSIPHVIMFTGPSGVGKTTLARILRVKLKCDDMDFEEKNASECRGIDEVRSIQKTIRCSSFKGGPRVILIDEAHGLTGDAQEALLKVLEETPPHVYFMICTTNPGKLKATLKSRCTEIKCKAVGVADLKLAIKRVVDGEGKTIDEDVIDRIAEVAEGSVRSALVVLHRVINVPTKEEQLAAIDSADVKGKGIELARLLMKPGSAWKDVAAVLKNIEEEPEAVRRIVLGYCNSVLLSSGSARAGFIISVFWDPLYDIGMPGLTQNCHRIVTEN